jgi:ribonuclease P protein component
MRISQKNENSQRQASHQSPAQAGPQKTDDCVELKFPKTARLLKKRHFQRVLKTGNKLVGNLIIIDYRIGKSFCPKLGITVSRRYGKAHLRNRFKRVVREAFRHYCPQMPRDIEINIIPRLPFQKVSKKAILNDLTALIARMDA